MEQDWRLNGQEKYLQNASLYKIVFPDFWDKSCAEKNSFHQEIWESACAQAKAHPETKEYLTPERFGLFWHEHCAFCWEKAMTNIDCEFYCTKGMRHWICKECFEDFKNKFDWSIRPTEELFGAT